MLTVSIRSATELGPKSGVTLSPKGTPPSLSFASVETPAVSWIMNRDSPDSGSENKLNSKIDWDALRRRSIHPGGFGADRRDIWCAEMVSYNMCVFMTLSTQAKVAECQNPPCR